MAKAHFRYTIWFMISEKVSQGAQVGTKIFNKGHKEIVPQNL